MRRDRKNDNPTILLTLYTPSIFVYGCVLYMYTYIEILFEGRGASNENERKKKYKIIQRRPRRNSSICATCVYECMSCDVRARNVHDSILYSTLIYRSPLSVSLSFLPLVLFTSFGQKSFEFSSLHLYSKVTKLLVYNT